MHTFVSARHAATAFALAGVAVAVPFLSASLASAQDVPYLNPLTQRLWQRHVPDFYQHQKWGNDAATPLLNDQDWQTVPVKVTLPDGSQNSFPTPVGWARHTTTANAFYHWRRMGFGNMAPSGVLSNSTWLNAANSMVESVSKTGSNIASELSGRGHGLGEPLGQRLAYTLYEVENGELVYRSATGTKRPLRANGQAIPIGLVAATEFAGGATVTAIVNKTGTGPFSSQLWWGNYHALTLAGIGLAQPQIFVADPDSNKGNADTNAGWSAQWPDESVNARKYLPWNGSADVIPVPALGAGFPAADPVGFESTYMPLALGPDLRTIDGAVESNGRYRNVQIGAIEVIRPLAAGTFLIFLPTDGMLYHSFDIGNGVGQGGPIDELWLIPNAPLDTITLICEPTLEVLDPWLEIQGQVEVLSAGTIDPHGNTIPHDAIRVSFDPPLHAEAYATLFFCTARLYTHSGDGYDVLYRSTTLSERIAALPPRVRSSWPAPESVFLVQTFGGAVEPYLPGDQIADVCIADFNADGMIDGADLGLLLNAWGTTLEFDLTGDGVVDGADLGIMLALWGPCNKQP